jgi:hypothetical protein
MPLILWADKADDLEFLTAYTSEAGYQHPSAHLKLRSVTITPASVGDYEAWTRSAPQNIVVRGKDPFQADASSTDWRYIRVAPGQDPSTAKYGPIGCYGLVRYPIPDSLKDDIRANWPADRPRFWAPKNWNAQGFGRMQGVIERSPPGDFIRALNTMGGPANGLLRSAGGGSFYSKAEIYGRRFSKPMISAAAMALDAYPLDADFYYYHKRDGGVRGQRERVKIDLGANAPRGQTYCARWPNSYAVRDTNNKVLPMTFEMDLGGLTIESKTGPQESGLSLIVIEEDKFWFQEMGLGISTEGGGLQ